MACQDKHAPLKSFKVKNKPKPFITNEIKQSIRSRNNLHKKAKFLRTPEAWCAFKSYRHQVKLGIRSAEKKYYSEQIMENTNNSSSIWKTVRAALSRKVSREVQYSKDTATLAEEFNHLFVSTGAKAAHASKESAETHGLHCDPPTCSRPNEISEGDLFHFHHVTTEDVTKVIMSMPSNKAPGYDKVPIRVIKDSLPNIVSTLTRLINLSFASNAFPQTWKQAKVIPHPKEGDHELPNNNRPISLLPAFSKVLERIALNQYLDNLTSHGRLTTHLSGNRKVHSTETLSLHVTDYIFKAIEVKKVTGMVLIDLRIAFDSLSHSVLLNELSSLGTSASAL